MKTICKLVLPILFAALVLCGCTGNKSNGQDKLAIYSLIQDACAQFKNQVGSLICAELLEGKVKVETSPVPEQRTAEYYKKRPCAELCEIAADITAKYI